MYRPTTPPSAATPRLRRSSGSFPSHPTENQIEGLFNGDIVLFATATGERLAELRNLSGPLWSSFGPKGSQFAPGFTAARATQ